ncbi:MAG: 3-keto-5-aminohexanoate cleavage protein [Pseudomonadota bacterium]
MTDPEPALLMAAPNGARKTKADHPALPMTPAEAAADARACVAAGARAIHIHARDAAGAHSLDPMIYRPFLDAVADAVGDDAVVQMTTEAVGRYRPAEMIDAVRALKPQAVSTAIRELFPQDDGSQDDAAAELLRWAVGEGVGLQYILYAAEDVARFRALQQAGHIPNDGYSLLLVLGRYSDGQRAVPRDLLALLNAANGDPAPWSICAFGPQEQACALTALALGGHARLGFENNEVLATGETAASNAALIRQTADLLDQIGCRSATAAEARRILRVG